jgi:hypothetical protein
VNTPTFDPRQFLAVWILAIAGGLLVAIGAALAIALLTFGILLGVVAVFPSLRNEWFYASQGLVIVGVPIFLGLLVAPLAGGLVIGKLQGKLFKEHNYSAPHWATVTVLGLYAGFCPFYILYARTCCAELTAPVAVAAFGAGLGLVQCLALRADMPRALVWPPINALAAGAALTSAGAISAAEGLRGVPGLLGPLAGVGLWFVLTSVTMFWLVRASRRSA